MGVKSDTEKKESGRKIMDFGRQRKIFSENVIFGVQKTKREESWKRRARNRAMFVMYTTIRVTWTVMRFLLYL